MREIKYCKRNHCYLGDDLSANLREEPGKMAMFHCDVCQQFESDGAAGVTTSAHVGVLYWYATKNLALKETTSILNHLTSLSVWITSSSPICIFIPDKLYLASPLDQRPWLSLYLGGSCSPFFSLAGKTADTKPGAAHTCWGLQQQSYPCSQEA